MEIVIKIFAFIGFLFVLLVLGAIILHYISCDNFNVDE